MKKAKNYYTVIKGFYKVVCFNFVDKNLTDKNSKHKIIYKFYLIMYNISYLGEQNGYRNKR